MSKRKLKKMIAALELRVLALENRRKAVEQTKNSLWGDYNKLLNNGYVMDPWGNIHGMGARSS